MFQNKAKLSKEEAEKLAEEVMNQSASEIRQSLVAHLVGWARENNKQDEIQALANQLKTVFQQVLEQGQVDHRVALLTLDFITDRFAVGFAREFGEVQIRQVEEKENGNGNAEVLN